MLLNSTRNVSKLIAKSGVLEVLSDLNDNGPSTFRDLYKLQSLHRSTLSLRLRELKEECLVRVTFLMRRTRGAAMIYEITPLGKRLLESAIAIGRLRDFLSSKIDQARISAEQLKGMLVDEEVVSEFARNIVNELRPELYSRVTTPIIEEERKTREVLAEKMDKLEGKLESVHIKLSGIEREVTIKRVAYGEFLIQFPPYLGIYRIHVPAGELTAKDLVKMKRQISNLYTQVLEKAKQESTSLHKTLTNQKQETMQRILFALQKLLGERRFDQLSEKLGRLSGPPKKNRQREKGLRMISP